MSLGLFSNRWYPKTITMASLLEIFPEDFCGDELGDGGTANGCAKAEAIGNRSKRRILEVTSLKSKTDFRRYAAFIMHFYLMAYYHSQERSHNLCAR